MIYVELDLKIKVLLGCCHLELPTIKVSSTNSIQLQFKLNHRWAVVVERSRASILDSRQGRRINRGVRGSNPAAAAYLDLDLFWTKLFRKHQRNQLIATTYIELTFR